MKKIFLYITSSLLTGFLLTSPVYADEVLSTVDQAVNQYKSGDYAGAASNLDFAAQLIRQKKSEELKGVFPEPLAGWNAEPATSQATGTSVFGRSVSVSRTYARKSSNVTIDIVTDSPVMQSLMMMLNNPVIAGAGGAKLETFSTHPGIIQYKESDRSGSVNIVVDKRFLVTVKGHQVDRDNLIAYAGAIRYAELTKK
ncbi:MAG TPA: hypothetical protein ENO11_04115 [Desulfobacteraceae bacterium]|nr:hypothetical protein [Desulfobacteraceae bacterium]